MVFQKSVLKKGLYGSNGELVGGKTNKLRPARLKWSLGRGYERERERERESSKNQYISPTNDKIISRFLKIPQNIQFIHRDSPSLLHCFTSG